MRVTAQATTGIFGDRLISGLDLRNLSSSALSKVDSKPIDFCKKGEARVGEIISSEKPEIAKYNLLANYAASQKIDCRSVVEYGSTGGRRQLRLGSRVFEEKGGIIREQNP